MDCDQWWLCQNAGSSFQTRRLSLLGSIQASTMPIVSRTKLYSNDRQGPIAWYSVLEARELNSGNIGPEHKSLTSSRHLGSHPPTMPSHHPLPPSLLPNELRDLLTEGGLTARMLDFQFIQVDASSAKARKRNHHLARAHSARAHQTQRRDDLIDIVVLDSSEKLQPPAVPLRRNKTKGEPPRSRTMTPTPTWTAGTVARPVRYADSAIGTPEQAPSSPLRTLSPHFGALVTTTFQPGVSSRGEQVAHYSRYTQSSQNSYSSLLQY